MTPKWRWPALVLAGALVLVSVASVAYAVGVANRSSNNVAPAAQPTFIPGNPGFGQREGPGRDRTPGGIRAGRIRTRRQSRTGRADGIRDGHGPRLELGDDQSGTRLDADADPDRFHDIHAGRRHGRPERPRGGRASHRPGNR